MSKFENAPEEKRSDLKLTLIAMVIPVVASVASLTIGLAIGGVSSWMLKPSPEPQIIEPTYDLSDVRFQAACAPIVADKTTRLEELNVEVGSLRDEIAIKEARIKELETPAKKNTASGKAARVELSGLQEELAQAKLALAQLTTEKAQLVERLNETVAQLEETQMNLVAQVQEASSARQEANVAREDATTARWGRFQNQAQLDICEKGGRKKMGNCRETVLAKLDQPVIRNAFTRCVSTGQATPEVHLLQKGQSLPEYSQMLGTDSVTGGWYVEMCDPTIPESPRVAAVASVPMSPVSTLASYASAAVNSVATSMGYEAPVEVAEPAAPIGAADEDWDTPAVSTAAAAPAYVPPPVQAYVPPAPVAAPAAVLTDDDSWLDAIPSAPAPTAAAPAAATKPAADDDLSWLLGDDGPTAADLDKPAAASTTTAPPPPPKALPAKSDGRVNDAQGADVDDFLDLDLPEGN